MTCSNNESAMSRVNHEVLQVTPPNPCIIISTVLRTCRGSGAGVEVRREGAPWLPELACTRGGPRVTGAGADPGWPEEPSPRGNWRRGVLVLESGTARGRRALGGQRKRVGGEGAQGPPRGCRGGSGWGLRRTPREHRVGGAVAPKVPRAATMWAEVACSRVLRGWPEVAPYANVGVA